MGHRGNLHPGAVFRVPLAFAIAVFSRVVPATDRNTKPERAGGEDNALYAKARGIRYKNSHMTEGRVPTIKHFSQWRFQMCVLERQSRCGGSNLLLPNDIRERVKRG